MAQRLFRYEVQYFSEYHNKEVTDKGIMTAGSYVNAVQRLCRPEEGYGPDVISIKVYDLIDDIITDNDLSLSLEMCNRPV